MTPEETEELMNDVRRAQGRMQRIAMVLIEHDMVVIREVAERVVVLNYGRKIAEGSYEEISSNDEVLKAYLGEEKNA